MNLLFYSFISFFYLKMNAFDSANLFSKSHLYKNYLNKINSIKNEVENENVKFCKDCKYFLPNKFLFITNNEFGKCALYNKLNKNDENYLVTGKKKEDTIEYSYCSICRNSEDKCGKEGKDFISKYNK